MKEGQPEPLLRPLPVVAPSLFLRVRKPLPVCGRSRVGGGSPCARTHRVARL
jgi:hypothetical protein